MKTQAISNLGSIKIIVTAIVALGFIFSARATPIPQRLIIIVHEEAWDRLSSKANRNALFDSWGESYHVELSMVREFGAHGWIVKLEKQLPKTELNYLVDEILKNPNIKYIEVDSRRSPSTKKDTKTMPYEGKKT